MVDPKLTTFLTLVEEKTTVRCAEALHLSQPAVTQHIRALEAEYGVKLFAKEGRRLTLTEAGARFYRLAGRLPAMEAQLRAALTEGQAAPLHFGVTRSIGEGLMPGWPRRCWTRCPRAGWRCGCKTPAPFWKSWTRER